jgi:hypothetical protein
LAGKIVGASKLFHLFPRSRPILRAATPSRKRRPNELKAVSRRDPHDAGHVTRGVKALLLHFDEEPLRTARRHRDQELAVTITDIPEAVVGATRHQHGIPLPQLQDLTGTPEAEYAGQDAEQFVLAMMNVHRRPSPRWNSLDPLREAASGVVRPNEKSPGQAKGPVDLSLA